MANNRLTIPILGEVELSSLWARIKQLLGWSNGKVSADIIPTIPQSKVENLSTSLGSKQDKITSTNKLAYSLISGTPTSLPANGGSATNATYIVDGDNKYSFNDISGISQTLSGHTGNTSNPHSVTKSQVGLGNVENKSSATIRGEITSSNVTTALGYTPLNSTLKGAASGLAELDANGKVPSTQLPSYVDDVLEYTNKASFPTTGETGKIYVDKTTNLTWRWSGSAYVEISPSLALGETSSTAYRGDRGKTAYDHSQATHARTDATKTEASSTNGKIKINGTETTVYTHPTSHAASMITGLATVATSGSYNDLSNKPTIPTKASWNYDDVYSKLGHTHDDRYYTESEIDTKLSGKQATIDASHKLAYSLISGTPTSLPANGGTSTYASYIGDSTNNYDFNDISGIGQVCDNHIANTSNPHSVTKAQVGLGNVGNFKAVSTVASQGLTDTEKSNARANIGAGTSSLALGTTATTAAAGNHTHTTSIATSTGTNQLTLAHGSKYAITAGGSSYVFTMPSIPTASTNTLGCVKIGAGLTISGGVVAPSFGTGYSNCARGNHTHSELSRISELDTVAIALTELSTRLDNSSGVQSVAVKMNGSIKGTITTSGTIDLGDVVIPSDLNSYSKKIVYSTSTSYNLTLYRYVDYPTYQVVTISSSTSTWKIYNTVPSGYSVYYGYPRYVRYTNTTTATKTIQINFSAVCGAKTYSLPAGKSVEVCIFEPVAGVTPTAKWSACDL